MNTTVLTQEQVTEKIAAVKTACKELAHRITTAIFAESNGESMRFDAASNGARYEDINDTIILASPQTHREAMHLPKSTY